MVLGVYWYYGFPEGLYHFDFFTHRPGIGGSSGGPAELTATVHAPDPAALKIAVLASLAAHGGQAGHLGTYPAHYPRRGPHAVRMVDASFVL
jgi:hypothetical protein